MHACIIQNLISSDTPVIIAIFRMDLDLRFHEPLFQFVKDLLEVEPASTQRIDRFVNDCNADHRLFPCVKGNSHGITRGYSLTIKSRR